MFFVCGSFVQYSGVEVGPCCTRGFPRGSVVKNLPAMQETWVRSLGQEDALEEGMATHSRILAWRTPQMEGQTRLKAISSSSSG